MVSSQIYEVKCPSCLHYSAISCGLYYDDMSTWIIQCRLLGWLILTDYKGHQEDISHDSIEGLYAIWASHRLNLLVHNGINISEYHVTSIFRDEEKAKQETGMKQIAIRFVLFGFLLGLPFNHEDGRDIFLWNICFQRIIRLYVSEYRTIFNRGVVPSFTWKGLRENIEDLSHDYRWKENFHFIENFNHFSTI